MTLAFTKMTGAGNDFVCVNNRAGTVKLTRRRIAALCHRQFGIGADGLLALEKATRQGVDCRMRYYNSDGGEAEMCGNGARCFARFAARVLRWKKPFLRIQTKAGLVTAEFSGEEVRVGLTPPGPISGPLHLVAGGGELDVWSVNTGVPHAVVFVEDAEAVDVVTLGRALRFHERFAPKGTNVNFVQRPAKGPLLVRTYERGVEVETLACGTGVAASALTAARVFGLTSPVRLRVAGGAVLEVGFEPSGDGFANVTLKGPATFVYEGTIDV
ncbi:MAG: diaminopimelate epimerase [Candidatus Methylacidiphilales bacterium]